MQNAYQGPQTIAKWSNLEVLTSATAVTAKSDLFCFILKQRFSYMGVISIFFN